MMKLIVANEYLAGPIFCPDPFSMGHIELADLHISKELKQEIQNWDNEYQATFDSAYPPDSVFKTPELKAAHAERGKKLAERLQTELGENYFVEYKP